jgi:hypothetical protein
MVIVKVYAKSAFFHDFPFNGKPTIRTKHRQAQDCQQKMRWPYLTTMRLRLFLCEC